MEALDKTRQALQEIRSQLQPALDRLLMIRGRPPTAGGTRRLLVGDGTDGTSSTGVGVLVDEQQQYAMAQTAVALTIGTLRFISTRLKGIETDIQNKKDPLRQELDQIRNLLVAVQKRTPPKQQQQQQQQQQHQQEDTASGKGSIKNKEHNKSLVVQQHSEVATTKTITKTKITTREETIINTTTRTNRKRKDHSSHRGDIQTELNATKKKRQSGSSQY